MICGVDPGKNGGLVILDVTGSLIAKSTMFYQDKIEYDPIAYQDFLLQNKVKHVVIEKVSAMPGNGSVSMFNFGQAYAFCRIVPILLKIPFTLVTPQAWQRVMHQGLDKSLPPKARSLIIYNRLYPHICLLSTSRCKKPHDGMLDAILIAEYGRRMNLC